MFSWWRKLLYPQSKKFSYDLVPWRNPVYEDKNYLIFRDGFPVTDGHVLYVPKFYDRKALSIVHDAAFCRGLFGIRYGHWDGFNIGLNFREAAGQTIMWPHVHLIPRRNGDCSDPRGGVRNVIPGKGNYLHPTYGKPIC